MSNLRTLSAGAIFTAVLVTAGGFLGVDVLFGSPSQHALMNGEGIVALSFLAVLCSRSRKTELTPAGAPNPVDALPTALAVAAIAIVIALAFTPILRTPFLYDDYTHIADASRATWRSVAREFGPVEGQGLFFRPLGFFFYWLNYLWAGAHPAWWHASNLALHVICCCLTYALCREVGISRTAGLAGALLVGLNGISAEAVAWIDAGFVMVTTALVLLSLIFVCRHASTARPVWLAAALAAGACGMLSKESGYCLPFLIACIALFRSREELRRILSAAGFAGVLTALLFAYRWWALGGIGGYSSTAGETDVLRFNVIRTLNGLLLREWAVLFYPINWSTPVSPMLRAALAAVPFLLAATAWMVRLPRRPLIGCLLFVVAAGLPVQQLLLTGLDLGGSRTLYLGSVGWALLWALLLNAMSRTPRMVSAGLLLLLQASLLEHNLRVWGDTAELARSVCVAFGKIAADTSGPLVVRNLPATRAGTVFLQNGFPQCVELNTGVPAGRIEVRSLGTEPGEREFVWSEAHGRIEAAPR